MSVTVIQPGSRRRYFIPRLFQERGMLGVFATDFTIHSWIGGLLKKAGLIKRPGLCGIPIDKIVSADTAVLLRELINRSFRKRSNLEYHLEVNRLITTRLKKRGIGDTDIIYCMNIGFADYLESVKKAKSDIRIICDLFMHPGMDHIINTASAKFSNWPYCQPCDKDMTLRESCFMRTAAVADVLLCPSEWVAQGVRELAPNAAVKIRLCPYGSSIYYGDRSNSPRRGRYFWAGTHAVLKGLPYLAAAANKLKPKYPDMDFRVAGITDKRTIEMPECRNLHFLGRLNKAQMQEEFLSADAFVFPTLSEGLAGVLVEAIACGCPVVTTRCGGIDITDGENGILIPEYSEPALIDALERIYSNRIYRTNISTRTKELAQEYSAEAWAMRLMSLIEEMRALNR